MPGMGLEEFPDQRRRFRRACAAAWPAVPPTLDAVKKNFRPAPAPGPGVHQDMFLEHGRFPDLGATVGPGEEGGTPPGTPTPGKLSLAGEVAFIADDPILDPVKGND